MEQYEKIFFNLAKGLKKWSEDKAIIPEELHLGHLQLIRLAVEHKAQFPADMHALIQFLKIPIGDWGIDKLKHVFPEEITILEENLGLSDYFEEWLEVIHSQEEYEEKIMYKILRYCRDREIPLDEEYRSIRTFLIKNPIITYFDLRDKFFNYDSELQELIYKCYEPIELPYENIYLCPYCGWTLEYKRSEWTCSTGLCKHQSDFSNFKRLNKNGNKYYRLTRGIQRFILLPGISELKIREVLANKGYDVQMYPEVDQYDLRVFNDKGLFIDIDVKDFTHPKLLAQHLNQTGLSKYKDHVFIVIPDYREDQYPKYIQRVKEAVDSDNAHLNVILAKDFIRNIEEIFHEKTNTSSIY